MSASESRPSRPAPSVIVRQDFVAGIAVIAMGVFGFWQGGDLPIGTLGGMGPGMLPKSLSVLLAALGALLAASSVMNAGPALERWSIRGPLLVLGAVALFGLTVRPYGLVVAGPLAVFIGAFASDEVRWKEAAVYAVVMTALCVALFKFALGLPIPLAPWWLGY